MEFNHQVIDPNISVTQATSFQSKSCIPLANQTSNKEVSCFFCAKKCASKSEFLTHFSVHFKNGKKDKRINLLPEFSTDEESENEESKQRHKNRRKRSKMSMNKKSRTFEYVLRQHTDPDGDSGCHSIDEEGSSCSVTTTFIESSPSSFSDCLGDSESSDSEGESKVPWSTKNYSENKHLSGSIRERLSLAEKQLDNNDTENLVCQTCLKRFSNCQNLRRHLRLHISRDSVTPDINLASKRCPNDLSDDAFFDGKYFCDWCPARFDNRSAARVHEGTHKGHETKCYVCEKSYADRYTLRYHLRTHGIGRQIQCEHCNKSFSKPSRLEAHIKSHHKNIRDFGCQQCDKKFKTRVHLRNHLQRHTAEKPFACSVCSDRFRHKASLVAHMRGHVGSKPFCCEVCGKTFREPSTLKAHCRVHSGHKPYRCNICDKSFTQRAGLNYHKKGHSECVKDNLCDDTKTGPLKMPTSMPSPPIQYGDAIFQASPLPSFDYLKPLSSPSASPTASTMSSTSESYMYPVRKLIHEEKPSFDLEEYSQDVTPPQTPPLNYNVQSGNQSDATNMLQPMNMSDFSQHMEFSNDANFYCKNYGNNLVGNQDHYRHHLCNHQPHSLLQEQHHRWFQMPYQQHQNVVHQNQTALNEYLNHQQYDYQNIASNYPSQLHPSHQPIIDQSQYNSFHTGTYHESNFTESSSAEVLTVHNTTPGHHQSSGYCL